MRRLLRNAGLSEPRLHRKDRDNWLGTSPSTTIIIIQRQQTRTPWRQNATAPDARNVFYVVRQEENIRIASSLKMTSTSSSYFNWVVVSGASFQADLKSSSLLGLIIISVRHISIPSPQHIPHWGELHASPFMRSPLLPCCLFIIGIFFFSIILLLIITVVVVDM